MSYSCGYSGSTVGSVAHWKILGYLCSNTITVSFKLVVYNSCSFIPPGNFNKYQKTELNIDTRV